MYVHFTTAIYISAVHQYFCLNVFHNDMRRHMNVFELEKLI